MKRVILSGVYIVLLVFSVCLFFYAWQTGYDAPVLAAVLYFIFAASSIGCVMKAAENDENRLWFLAFAFIGVSIAMGGLICASLPMSCAGWALGIAGFAGFATCSYRLRERLN